MEHGAQLAAEEHRAHHTAGGRGTLCAPRTAHLQVIAAEHCPHRLCGQLHEARARPLVHPCAVEAMEVLPHALYGFL